MGSPGERNVSVGIMSVRGFGKPPQEGQFSPQRQLAGALF